MTVLTSAWVGSGFSFGDEDPGDERCACCGDRAGSVPVRSAVSKTFTGFDSWVDPVGRQLCACCAWGYSTPELRAGPLLVTRTPAALRQLSRQEAGEVLARGAVGQGECVVIPLRPGRKHLLPGAGWGRVSVDDANLTWTGAHAELLGLVHKLRSMGFGSRMLAEPAPSFRVLSSLPAEQYTTVLRDWEQLAPWRTPDNPWLSLAIHVTLPTTTKGVA